MKHSDLRLSELPPTALVDYNAARNRVQKRVEEREHLRYELKAREYIHVCHDVIDRLHNGYELVEQGQGLEPVKIPLDRTRTQSLKAAMDGSLRLLDRVLPALKAIEIQDSPEKAADAMTLTTSDLLKLAGQMNRDAEPKIIEGCHETVIEDDPDVVLAPPPWEGT